MHRCIASYNVLYNKLIIYNIFKPGINAGVNLKHFNTGKKPVVTVHSCELVSLHLTLVGSAWDPVHRLAIRLLYAVEK